MGDKHKFYEFFAGGGMARAGLGSQWQCTFANDFDGKKALAYQDNWGTGGELKVGDISQLSISDMPDTADLAWGSFPCQDLSLAGGGAGLRGERSGTFYPFWNIMDSLIAQGRAPRIIALENVCGTLTSNGGEDFSAICDTFAKRNYRFGSVVINASLFVPQSRPRLFIIGLHESLFLDPSLLSPGPSSVFHTTSLQRAHSKLNAHTKGRWLWWNLPSPKMRTSTFADLIEDHPNSVSWNTSAQTKKLLSMMTPLNLAKVEAAKRTQRRMVGTVYKRTRPHLDGRAVRAEVRFDDISGCLRTPNGGSSRQSILIVEGDEIRSRLLSTRETARLMGLPDAYRLPKNYNAAYHLMGDGVAAPVVSHLAEYIFEPVLDQNIQARQGFTPMLEKDRQRLGHKL